MKKAEVLFIPPPGFGHIGPVVEFAKTLTGFHDHLSITILTMDAPFSTIPPGYIDSVTTHTIRFIKLTPPDQPSPAVKHTVTAITEYIEDLKPHAKRVISQFISELNANSVSLAAILLDMFTTSMIDIAKEVGVPSYVYYTCSAAALGLALQYKTLDEKITTDFIDYPGELQIPSFKNSIPPQVLPSIMSRKDDDYKWFFYLSRRLAEAKGIIVNSFYDLEPHAFASFDSLMDIPRVHSVGPVVDRTTRVSSGRAEDNKKIMTWLDKQAPSSVVFLCFGSNGTFEAAQAKEIAIGLEQGGHRFLWSLRPRPDGGSTSFKDLVPEGFLERTADRGLVCGWVPQVAVLGHEAIACFVSHCGWNSTLESLFFGVPILTWPLYAEQKLNAWELVRELGLGMELRRYDRGAGNHELTMSDEVRRGVRKMMEGDNEVRKKTMEMKEKSRRAVMEGGSSYLSIKGLLDEWMHV